MFAKECLSACKCSRVSVMTAFAVLRILPAFAGLFGVQAEFAQFFGGTSLLILVGVDLDTMSQVEAMMKMHHQDGLVKKGKLRSRNL